jgi:hypothetical protein
MYVCIKKKSKGHYCLKYNSVFYDRYILLRELYKEDNLSKDEYYIFDLNSANNLLTDALFMTYYKYLYLQLHLKNPQLYPVKYICTWCCSASCTCTTSCTACACKKNNNYILKKFFDSVATNEKLKTYSEFNCIIYMESKNKIDYFTSDINMLNLDPFVPNTMLYICLSYNKQMLMPWGVFTNFKDALEETINTIIKSHDFYIIPPNKLCFMNFYYIYGFNMMSDNQLCKSCVLEEDWYSIYDFLKNLSHKKTLSITDINNLKYYKNKIALCGKFLYTSIFNELRKYADQRS